MSFTIIYTLNLIDLCLTLCALSLGVEEANPLMQSVPIMVFYKVIVVGGLLWWLTRRPERIARLGLRLCGAVYAGLAFFHLIGLYNIPRKA